MTTKAIRASISVAGIEIEVFQLPSGEYVMSQTQVADAVGKAESHIRNFLGENQLKSLPTNGSKFAKVAVEDSRKPINVVPAELASAFWGKEAARKNEKALMLVIALAQETLQRRCDDAFNVTKIEQQYEQQTANWLEKWQQTRQYLSETHNSFTMACHDYGFPPASTHDKLTLAVCGMTAAELRKFELVCGNKEVGLNHIEEAATLRKVARVKYHFSRYRKGTVAERIDRAIKDTLKEKNTP